MDKRIFNEKDKKNFRKYADSHAEKSNLPADCIVAFIVGGIICVIGQGVGDIAKKLGVNEENIKAVIPVALILLSCALTSIGIYDKIAKHAGAGTLVPIMGFANAVCSPAIDSRSEGFILGVGAKMFTIAGPVIVYGTVTSIIWGVIYFFMNL